MSALLTALIIEAEFDSRKAIEDHLVNTNVVSVQGTTHDLQAGYRMVGQLKPALAMISLDADPTRALSLIENIAQSHPETIVFAVSADKSSDLILRAMRAGAMEFLVKPVRPDELATAVGKLQRARMARSAPGSASGKIITVFSAKGGSGSTTVATNLASSLARMTDRPVVLVDMDLQTGDVATFLNVTPDYTIMDLAHNISRVDANFLKMSLAKHSSGVYVLAEPPHIEEVEQITASHVRQVLSVVRSMAGYVIVDARKSFDDRLAVILEQSDLIVLVSVLSVPAVKNIRRAIEIFQRLGFQQEKIRLLVNRYISHGEISVRDVEKTLQMKVSWTIPNDFNQVMSSINRGSPVALSAPDSEIGRAFAAVASDISGRPVSDGDVKNKESLIKRLFRS